MLCVKTMTTCTWPDGNHKHMQTKQLPWTRLLIGGIFTDFSFSWSAWAAPPVQVQASRALVPSKRAEWLGLLETHFVPILRFLQLQLSCFAVFPTKTEACTEMDMLSLCWSVSGLTRPNSQQCVTNNNEHQTSYMYTYARIPVHVPAYEHLCTQV